MKELLLPCLLLVVGFVLLVYGADFFVDGCSSIAKSLRIPSIIIGLTIVALGTSAPEAAVSITASLSGSNDISIGNCVGSNFFNLLVVAGFCALFRPLPVSRDLIKRDFPFSILITIILLIMSVDTLFGATSNTLGRIDGIILFALYIAFMIVLIRSALKNRTEADEEIKVYPIWKSLLFIIFGAAAIIYGGDLVVDNATIIAKYFRMSETLIGLTIVALGTSLPELVTSIVASKKGEVDLAMGNVIGSNIANILVVLGLSSAVSAMPVNSMVLTDTVILIGITIIVYLMSIRDKTISRREGVIMLLMYAAYTVYIFARNFT
jgi:cation:H+ antiporter